MELAEGNSCVLADDQRILTELGSASAMEPGKVSHEFSQIKIAHLYNQC